MVEMLYLTYISKEIFNTIKLIFCKLTELTQKNEFKAVSYKKLYAMVGGLESTDFVIDKLLKEPTKISSAVEKIRIDSRVTELQRFDSFTIRDSFSLHDEGGKEINPQTVDNFDRNPIQFIIKLNKTDMKLTERFSRKYFESIDSSIEFTIIYDGFYALYFSEIGSDIAEHSLFLDARDKVKDILNPLNPQSIPPDLADEIIAIKYNDDKITVSVSDNEYDLGSAKTSQATKSKVAKGVYNALKLQLDFIYAFAKHVSVAHKNLSEIRDLNAKLLSTYTRVFETPRWKLYTIYKLSKDLNLDVANLMGKINSYFDSKNASEKWNYNEQENGIEKLLQPIKKEVLSLLEEDVQPEIKILELIISQITGNMQLLKSYYVVAISALAGAVAGAIMSKII